MVSAPSVPVTVSTPPVESTPFPLGMVESLRLMTPIGSTLVGFMFLALDQIGRDLEAPFENDEHDVPLTSLSKTIEINLKQLLGDTELPDPVKPLYGVLW